MSIRNEDLKKPKILIADDDRAIRIFIRANLEIRDYEILLAMDGEEAIKLTEQELPDLLLLDIMMPKIDGFEVCRRVREWSKVPIIMLSAREGESDKVKCLDSGADDYLTKPFSLKELLSRIKAVLRRTQNDNISFQPKYCCGELEVDLTQNKVSLAGEEIILTGTEYKILSYLTVNAGRVITPNQLLQKVWGEEYVGANHLLQSMMARLRHKLRDDSRNPKYILTNRGIGYELRKMPAIT